MIRALAGLVETDELLPVAVFQTARRMMHRTLPVFWLLACAALPYPAAAGVKVTLEGLQRAERDNVEARLGILKFAQDKDASKGASEAQIRRLHRQAEDDIRGALQVYGFYSPRIRSELRQEDDDWLARYRIEPGPPVELDRVRLEIKGEGREFPALTAALGRSRLKQGQRLLHADYEETKAELSRAAYQNGFLDAQYSAHRLAVDVPRRRAQVTLVLETGPRYFFGELRVEQEGLDQEFLARYIPIRYGEPFEPQKLLDAQFALSDLGYFGSVDVRLMREEAVDRHIPVVISATPRPKRRYDIGAGYGTDTGARATLGVEFRRLGGAGHKLRTDLRMSEVKNSVGADYRIPLGTKAGENLGFAAGYTDEKFGDGDGDSRRFDLSTSLTRTPGDWQRRVYLNYLYEETFFTTTGRNLSKLLFPGVSLARGETDDPIHARLGWYLFVDLHGTHKAVVSDTSFLQGKTVLRGVVPLGERARLVGRAEFGASLVEEFAELPASQRFFAGGDQSVRGYGYQSLGPRDASGTVVGGRFLNTYSAEAEYRIWGNWGAAVFLDLGNAANDPGPSLFAGTGAGLRYRAPIGTLQLDLAHPLDGDERGIRPHIGIRVGL
jgi:translocation and assembly module TamA